MYKPVKIIIEDNSTMTMESCYPSNEETYNTTKHTLLILLLDKKITTQQYRAEKGKIKKGYLQEVLNFIKKRDFELYYKLLEFKTNKQDYLIFTRQLGFNSCVLANVNYGTISLED